jgi:quercetin dioxygenase-like cupin family protein
MAGANHLRNAFGALLLTLAASSSPAADAPHEHAKAFAGCIPVAERKDERIGCYVLSNQELGKLPDTQIYWHLYSYSTPAAAAAAQGTSGHVVQLRDEVWLFAVTDGAWSPSGGKRVARVGPLPIAHAGNYTASYMEAIFTPGMKSAVHRHAGPEAWYVLAGEQCLETPGKAAFVRAGESGIVPEGPPMILWGTGKSERRALVLILHDSTKAMTLPASDWKSEGRCQQ